MATVALTITTVGRNYLRDSLSGQSNANGRITYFSVGTGTTTPSVSDTKLAAEVYRTVFQSAGPGTNIGEELLNGFIDLAFANGLTLTETGIWGGPTVSGTANSGILIARALLSPTIAKNNAITVSLNFDMQY